MRLRDILSPRISEQILGRKRKNIPSVNLGGNDYDTSKLEAPFTPEPTLSETSPERKALYYSEDNGVLVLRDSQKEVLRDFFQRSDVQDALGISAAEAKDASAAVDSFGDDEVNAILDFLQPILAIGGVKILKFSPAVAAKAYVFDEFQRKKLSARGARLLNKWGPTIFKTWKDEIGFGIVLFSCIAAQTKDAKNYQDKENRDKVRQISTPPPKTELPASATGD